MSRIAYVNGQYLPHSAASVHIEDRGYQFADGVYEVITMINGHLHDCDGHLKRLARSLSELKMSSPVSELIMRMIISRLIRLNHLKNGTIYLQVTRGVARRDHKFPAADTRPSLVMTVKHLKLATQQPKGVKTITVADQRWARRDIKTVQLLPNCLAKQAAFEKGAYEAIMMMPDGSVSEGSSSNVWMVTKDDVIVTRPADSDILNGITRQAVYQLAEDRQMKVEERRFTEDELYQAKEVFLTSATSLVTSVTTINDTEIGEGIMGEVAISLRANYLSHP